MNEATVHTVWCWNKHDFAYSTLVDLIPEFTVYIHAVLVLTANKEEHFLQLKLSWGLTGPAGRNIFNTIFIISMLTLQSLNILL